MARKQFKGLAKDFINAMKMQFIGQGANPNDIFVQDLFNYEPTNSGVKNILKKSDRNIFNQLSTEDRRILETILQVYNEKISTKRELLLQSRRLFETDIVQTVIDVMIDDHLDNLGGAQKFKIIFDYPYNRDFTLKDMTYFRCYNWEEIYGVINMLSGKA